MQSHIYPEAAQDDDSQETSAKWSEVHWWYTPAVTFLWVVVVASILIAPALVLAVWRQLP
jgi:uncharacterized membrane protein YdjX (TVP38/TMEM64 family)